MARPVTRSERAVKWARRKPAIAALMGLVALVGTLGLGGVLWQWRAAVRARNVAQDREQDAIKAQAKERTELEQTRQSLEPEGQRKRSRPSWPSNVCTTSE